MKSDNFALYTKIANFKEEFELFKEKNVGQLKMSDRHSLTILEENLYKIYTLAEEMFTPKCPYNDNVSCDSVEMGKCDGCDIFEEDDAIFRADTEDESLFLNDFEPIYCSEPNLILDLSLINRIYELKSKIVGLYEYGNTFKLYDIQNKLTELEQILVMNQVYEHYGYK